jgi:uncharacterized protein (DUF2147 family)
MALWPFLSASKADASTMNGTWRIENMVLEIFDCQQLVCGRIVWIGEEAKRPTQCGKTIVWGLSQKSPTVWKDGAIHDPNTDKTYSLSATFQPDGELRARIFQGVEVLGQTKMLRRVGEKSLSGWC